MNELKLSVRGVDIEEIPFAVHEATYHKVRIDIDSFQPFDKLGLMVILRGEPRNVIALLTKWGKIELVKQIRESVA